MITTNKAKKLLKEFMMKESIGYERMTAKTVGFSDLARTDYIFVTIYGFVANRDHVAKIREFSAENGFIVQFDGFIS